MLVRRTEEIIKASRKADGPDNYSGGPLGYAQGKSIGFSARRSDDKRNPNFIRHLR